MKLSKVVFKVAENILQRNCKRKEKRAISKISVPTRQGNVLPQRWIHIPNSIRETPIPPFEISKNIINSRAENHLIFKGAFKHDFESCCAPLRGASSKKELALPSDPSFCS
jgi:hypothetical protein